MLMNPNIKIVLVSTSHPGNIGGVARAMKNMCLEKLVLVNPKRFPDQEANARAAGADDILENAQKCSTLDEAVADCGLVIGASARLRTVKWPQLDPRACAEKVINTASQTPVAIVFGRESSGLTNEELERCSHLVHIPANPEHSSLNIGMAVQVITYEIMMAQREEVKTLETEEQATAADLQGLFDHLEQMVIDVGFADKRRSPKLMRRLKRLLYRATPDLDEINILRGIFSAAQGRKSMRPTEDVDNNN